MEADKTQRDSMRQSRYEEIVKEVHGATGVHIWRFVESGSGTGDLATIKFSRHQPGANTLRLANGNVAFRTQDSITVKK